MQERDIFRSLSPLDYRYFDEEVADYLSEEAFIRYKLKVELALVKVLAEREVCSQSVVDEVAAAIINVTAEEVYAEERKTFHDIRALVNCIQRRVSDEAKPFVHMTATSYDIVSTAEALRYRDVMRKVVLPNLQELIVVLAEMAMREAETAQIGRTHGQHAVPITFGFTIMEYVVRLFEHCTYLENLTEQLVGKFSGAVGAYNASSLFFDDPEEFEEEIMRELGIECAHYSTQIAPPEPLARLLYENALGAGIIANLADDMRNLQRSEIAEVGEEFVTGQVGSSTMAQKNNPINFENCKSMWKILVPKIQTVLMDQISEHQRDLTNSASSRTYGEIVACYVSMCKRMTKTMRKLRVNEENLQKNLRLQGDLIMAEPLYLLLARQGHPDAHEKVKQLSLIARTSGRSMVELVAEDEELKPYAQKFDERQKAILADPEKYSGIAAEIADNARDILAIICVVRERS